MAVTIKDVAREAGVSFSTVSKVVNHSPEIPEATAEKVRAVMERLDYTPNVRASSFKRRSTRNVAFLTALKKGEVFENPHMFEILCGAHGALAKKGYSLTLVDVSEDTKPGATAKTIITNQGYDGMLVHGSAISPSVAAMMVRSQFPHIVIGKPEFSSAVCWMDTNNVLAGGIAARHLAEGGAGRIAFIGGGREERISTDRLRGVCNTLEELGQSILKENILYTNSSIAESYDAAKKQLANNPRPDALICENNTIALGALKAVRESGLSMPDELQLITFDDYPFSQVMDPPPTVVNIDVYDLGMQAASQLLKNIRNPALHVQSYITLPELIERGTTK